MFSDETPANQLEVEPEVTVPPIQSNPNFVQTVRLLIRTKNAFRRQTNTQTNDTNQNMTRSSPQPIHNDGNVNPFFKAQNFFNFKL